MNISIHKIEMKAQKGSYEELELLLKKEKTALNERHLLKIVNRYYYDAI